MNAGKESQLILFAFISSSFNTLKLYKISDALPH